MGLRDQIQALLLAGGMSDDSSVELSSYLALHYPEHVVILMAGEQVEGAPE